MGIAWTSSSSTVSMGNCTSAPPSPQTPRDPTSNLTLHSTNTMQLGLTENLSALVARRFTTAKEAGHLVFSSTHLSILTTAGVPVRTSISIPLNQTPTHPHSSPHKVPTPLLSRPRQKTHKPKDNRNRPQTAQTRPLQRPLTRPPHRLLPTREPVPRPRPEQIPRHPKPLHPRDARLETTNRPTRAGRSVRDLRVSTDMARNQR